jgi:NAD(P)-dependent dehydrogenase (short-subunit alcohol dehydrogenase family)
MQQSDDARVVTVSSGAHRMGRIQFDDLQSKRRYFRWRAYGQSKLANLLFAFELDRRLRAAGSSIRSVAAHPGYAATNLQSAAPPMVDRLVMVVTNRLLAQSVQMGVLPQLYAATNPAVEGGQYIGPDGIAEQRGYPKLAGSSGAARDEAAARRLWEVSEELTGVPFEVPVAVSR